MSFTLKAHLQQGEAVVNFIPLKANPPYSIPLFQITEHLLMPRIWPTQSLTTICGHTCFSQTVGGGSCKDWHTISARKSTPQVKPPDISI